MSLFFSSVLLLLFGDGLTFAISLNLGVSFIKFGLLFLLELFIFSFPNKNSLFSYMASDKSYWALWSREPLEFSLVEDLDIYNLLLLLLLLL